MKGTLLTSAVIQVSLYLIMSYYGISNYYVIIGLIINTFFLVRILFVFGFQYACIRLCRGQIFPLYLYMGWLILYNQGEHLYKLPVLFSTIGKSYLLFSFQDEVWIDAVESLIKLQSQCELFLTLYHILKYFLNLKGFNKVIELLLLLGIMKLKLEIHYGTRKFYESLHFSLDRISKSLNMRGFYHFIQRFVSKLAGQWRYTKIISY